VDNAIASADGWITVLYGCITSFNCSREQQARWAPREFRPFCCSLSLCSDQFLCWHFIPSALFLLKLIHAKYYSVALFISGALPQRRRDDESEERFYWPETKFLFFSANGGVCCSNSTARFEAKLSTPHLPRATRRPRDV
jgi:hypothetical protein